FHERLDALEAILPWNHHADRRAVLIRQSFAVHSNRQECEWIHRFVNSQSLDIRQFDTSHRPFWHLLHVVVALERDVLCVPAGFDQLRERAERISDPWNDDRPGFDATVAIDAL